MPLQPQDGGKIVPKQLKETIIRFVSGKNLDGFIKSIIDFDNRDRTGYAITHIILEIFDSWKNFKEFLYNYGKENNFIEEFISFFDLFEKVGFKEYVKFEFNDISLKGSTKE